MGGWGTAQRAEQSTQKFAPNDLGATVQRAVGFAKWMEQKRGWGELGRPKMEWGQGPGAKHPLGTVQSAQVGIANQLCSWAYVPNWRIHKKGPG